ncbi:hypothetical protein BOQ63_001480 (plasmid) [Streptomyces viridifaciens]|nr:hypothetical protein BOQ63_001480 [Streptomyces viridifaciens]
MDLPADYTSPVTYCSRRTRAGRPCRREATDWPSGYDDLPVRVACRSHLTDDEWARCLEARKRRNAVWRDNHPTLIERAALAEVKPPAEPDDGNDDIESSKCRRQCEFVKIPGRSSDDDVCPFYCANCDSSVCYGCGKASVEYEDTLCRSCDSLPCDDNGRWDRAPGSWDDELDLDTDDVDHGPDPRGRLTRLVNEIAAATGDTHREVNARINREVGVRSRVGADEETVRRASAVASVWLAKLTTARAGS